MLRVLFLNFFLAVKAQARAQSQALALALALARILKPAKDIAGGEGSCVVTYSVAPLYPDIFCLAAAHAQAHVAAQALAVAVTHAHSLAQGLAQALAEDKGKLLLMAAFVFDVFFFRDLCCRARAWVGSVGSQSEGARG